MIPTMSGSDEPDDPGSLGGDAPLGPGVDVGVGANVTGAVTIGDVFPALSNTKTA